MNTELLNSALKVWQRGPKLDEENYHNSTGFLSNSFIGDFLKCEYNAVINYAFKPEEEFQDYFAIGQTVEHIIFEGHENLNEYLKRYGDKGLAPVTKKAQTEYDDICLAHDFKTMGDLFRMSNGKLPTKQQIDKLERLFKENPVISKKPEPTWRAWVYKAVELSKTVTKHKNLVSLFRADNSDYHKIFTFEMFGMMWRIEVDYLNLNKETEIDLKTNRDFDMFEYNEDTRKKDLSFIDTHDYHRQRGIYQKGIFIKTGVHVTPRILAINKKTKSVRMFRFDDQDRLDFEIRALEPVVDRVKEVLSGETEPRQCEVCPNCVESENTNFEIKTSQYCANWR